MSLATFTPPKTVATASVTVSLQIGQRTVRYHHTQPVDAKSFELFGRKGYWVIGFLATGARSQSLTLCGGSCSDSEPAYASYGAPFTNLKVLSPRRPGQAHAWVLTGTVAIRRAAAISDVDADFWVCPHGVALAPACANEGPAFWSTLPKPARVSVGDRVEVTYEISIAPKHG